MNDFFESLRMALIFILPATGIGVFLGWLLRARPKKSLPAFKLENSEVSIEKAKKYFKLTN